MTIGNGAAGKVTKTFAVAIPWRRRRSAAKAVARSAAAKPPIVPSRSRIASTEQIDRRPPQDNRQSNRQDDRKVSFDQAVAEITARQRALDSEAAAAIKTRQRELTNLAANLDRQPDDFSGYAETDRFAAAETAPEPAFTRPQPPPILPREDVFDEPAAGAAFTSQPPPLRLREESVSAWNAGPPIGEFAGTGARPQRPAAATASDYGADRGLAAGKRPRSRDQWAPCRARGDRPLGHGGAAAARRRIARDRDQGAGPAHRPRPPVRC